MAAVIATTLSSFSAIEVIDEEKISEYVVTFSLDTGLPVSISKGSTPWKKEGFLSAKG